MNRSMVYLITLLCAVIAKAEKGFEECLSSEYSLSAYRILAQLSLPESSCMSPNELAHALVEKPTTIESALNFLGDKGDLYSDLPSRDEMLGSSYIVNETERCPLAYRLTSPGRNQEKKMRLRFSAFLEKACEPLSPSDSVSLRSFFYKLLVKPGSFFSYRASSLSEENPLPIPYCISAICLLDQAISSAAKYNTGLSLTDFRFLLELMPKRRGTSKQLRAKEVVRYLRVSRSYVSVTAVRLEKEKLIVRVPDKNDARGVFFRLSPQGELAVADVADDVYALLGGMIGQQEVGLALFRALRSLLQGVDGALLMMQDYAV